MDLSRIIEYEGRVNLTGIDPGPGQMAFLHGRLKITFLDYVGRTDDTRTPSLMVWRFFAGEENWKKYILEQAWNQTITTVKDWHKYVSYASKR